MGYAISVPLLDGRIFADNTGREYTVIYYDNVYIDLPELSDNTQMADGVVLLDPDCDVLCLSKSEFVENYIEIPESVMTPETYR